MSDDDLDYEEDPALGLVGSLSMDDMGLQSIALPRVPDVLQKRPLELVFSSPEANSSCRIVSLVSVGKIEQQKIAFVASPSFPAVVGFSVLGSQGFGNVDWRVSVDCSQSCEQVSATDGFLAWRSSEQISIHPFSSEGIESTPLIKWNVTTSLGSLCHLAWHPEASLLFALSFDGEFTVMSVLNPNDKSIRQVPRKFKGVVNHIAWKDDLVHVACIYNERDVIIFSVDCFNNDAISIVHKLTFPSFKSQEGIHSFRFEFLEENCLACVFGVEDKFSVAFADLGEMTIVTHAIAISPLDLLSLSCISGNDHVYMFLLSEFDSVQKDRITNWKIATIGTSYSSRKQIGSSIIAIEDSQFVLVLNEDRLDLYMVHLDLLEPPGDFDIDDSLPLSVSSFVPPLYSTLVGFSPGKGLFDIPQAQKTSIASTSSSDINRDLNVPSGSVKPFSLFDQVSATSGASQPKSMFGSDVFGRTRSSSSSHQPSFSIPSALATNSQSHEEAKSPTLAARKEERRVPAKAHPPEAKITMLNTLIPLFRKFHQGILDLEERDAKIKHVLESVDVLSLTTQADLRACFAKIAPLLTFKDSSRARDPTILQFENSIAALEVEFNERIKSIEDFFASHHASGERKEDPNVSDKIEAILRKQEACVKYLSDKIASLEKKKREQKSFGSAKAAALITLPAIGESSKRDWKAIEQRLRAAVESNPSQSLQSSPATPRSKTVVLKKTVTPSSISSSGSGTSLTPRRSLSDLVNSESTGFSLTPPAKEKKSPGKSIRRIPENAETLPGTIPKPSTPSFIPSTVSTSRSAKKSGLASTSTISFSPPPGIKSSGLFSVDSGASTLDAEADSRVRPSDDRKDSASFPISKKTSEIKAFEGQTSVQSSQAALSSLSSDLSKAMSLSSTQGDLFSIPSSSSFSISGSLSGSNASSTVSTSGFGSLAGSTSFGTRAGESTASSSSMFGSSSSSIASSTFGSSETSATYGFASSTAPAFGSSSSFGSTSATFTSTTSVGSFGTSVSSSSSLFSSPTPLSSFGNSAMSFSSMTSTGSFGAHSSGSLVSPASGTSIFGSSSSVSGIPSGSGPSQSIFGSMGGRASTGSSLLSRPNAFGPSTPSPGFGALSRPLSFGSPDKATSTPGANPTFGSGVFALGPGGSSFVSGSPSPSFQVPSSFRSSSIPSSFSFASSSTSSPFSGSSPQFSHARRADNMD